MSHKSLAQQAKDRIGKTHDLGHETIEKNQGNLERLMDRIEDKYGLERIQNLKTKHIDGVFADMREEGLSPSTIAGYATVARDIAEAIGKENIVRSNEELGASRQGTRLNPKIADQEKMSQIQEFLNRKDDWLGAAWQLQQALGLRLAEGIKPLKIVENERGELSLEVIGKGGHIYRPPINTPERVEAVARAFAVKEMQGGKGLIPPEKSFKQGYDKCRNEIRNAGGTKANMANSQLGRHTVIQERLGGSVRSASPETRAKTIREVGHYDEAKLRHYCDL